MADQFFDVDGLAAYLHMMPAKIAKLADRGNLPGRRVGGQWRFARADIHHWLEERMGISSDGELAEMEDMLEQSEEATTATSIRMVDLLPLEAIAVPLPAKTQNSVIHQMAELAASTGRLWDPVAMADAVRAREAMHTTALDNGVALLHPRRPMGRILEEAVLSLGISPSGIPFGNRTLTDVFFLICSTTDHEHLRILARISRLIHDTALVEELHDAPDAAAIHALITARDDELG
ncbi:MAG: PTS sugar transporter subunit IIA [Pirellulales bacterium]|nr:PTS sugar transporter subunit IIA [Pirellulales bacterium]